MVGIRENDMIIVVCDVMLLIMQREARGDTCGVYTFVKCTSLGTSYRVSNNYWLGVSRVGSPAICPPARQ